jgi:hypothetical protein
MSSQAEDFNSTLHSEEFRSQALKQLQDIPRNQDDATMSQQSTYSITRTLFSTITGRRSSQQTDRLHLVASYDMQEDTSGQF